MEALAKAIPTDIIEYNLTDAAIQALDEKYQGMEITDGKSYKAIVVGIGEMRHYRLRVEATRVQLKANALAFGRKVDGEAKRITGLLVPIEDRLKAVKKVDNHRREAKKAEKERIKKERIDRIQVRIIKIISMGTNLGNFNAEQLNALICDISNLDITSEEYQEQDIYAQQAKDDALEAAKSALVERAKLDQEAAERKADGERLATLKKEQEKEAKRLERVEKEQEEKEAKRTADLVAQRQEIEDEKAHLKAEALKQKRDQRIAALYNIGLPFDGEQFCFLDVNVHWVDVVTWSDEEFDKKIEELGALVIQRKENAQAQAIRDAETKRVQEEMNKIALEKAEAEERARQEALKPDKQKLYELAGRIEAFEFPEVKDDRAQAILTEAKEALVFTAQTIREEVGEL